MDLFVKLSMLVIFFGVMIAVGLYCKKHSTDVSGFVLGGRKVGPWLTAFAYGTSYFSAVIFVGYAGQFGWKYGVAATWIGIANALLGSLLAWAVLGRRTRVMTQHLDSATMPQFFASRYGSRGLKLAASAIIFVFLIPYTASLYNGLSRLFEMAFHVDYAICVIVMAVLTAVYVIAGGFMATAVNDFIQGIIMLFGIVAVVAAVLAAQGGFSAAITDLAAVSDGTTTVPGVFASFFGPDPLGLIGVMILTSLGTWGLPQMVQKFYAIKSEQALSKGLVISTLFATVVAGGCYFLGGFGRLFSDRVDVAKAGYDAIVPAMLAGLPSILIALVVILVLSASMSTLSSLVLTSSSTLTLDFVRGTVKKEMSEKQSLLTMRVLIAVFIAVSAGIAIFQYRSGVAFIAQLMGISWGAMAGAFLAPFLYGLYWKKASRAGCWVSFGFSTVVMMANILARSIFPAFLQSPINAGALCMLAGLVLTPLFSLLLPDKKDR
ncbi:MAG: sodium:solute symporter, partial [Clostridia bacterium]|nr:sodium:solute symporter [Clostridia bacterium]